MAQIKAMDKARSMRVMLRTEIVLHPTRGLGLSVSDGGRGPVTTQACCDWSPAKISLVEARGVEPLSEDRQRTASTCVADSLSFAAIHAHRQA